MSQPTGILEQILASNLALIAAVEANTAALNGGAGKTTSTSTKTTNSKNTKTTEKSGPKYTKEQTVAAVVAFKDAAGAPAARDLLAAHGVDKVANVKPDQHDAVHDAAVAALEAFNAEKGGEDEANDDI